MKDNIEQLGSLFSEIVENYNDGSFWRNIPLAKEAFAMMRDTLPLRVPGELTPYTRVVLLSEMLECLPERDCARFILEVRDYQLSMFGLIKSSDAKEDMDMDKYEGSEKEYVRKVTREDVKSCRQRTEDYLSMPMEEWCSKYGIHLKFDPVEQTEEWEKVIYDVEKECDKRLKGVTRRMGFCFEAWSTKRSVLAEYGIDWSSPGVMNPRVMFD